MKAGQLRVANDQPPGLVVAEPGRQISKQGTPLASSSGRLGPTRSLNRHSTELGEKSVPGVPLVGTQGRERGDAVR